MRSEKLRLPTLLVWPTYKVAGFLLHGADQPARVWADGCFALPCLALPAAGGVGQLLMQIAAALITGVWFGSEEISGELSETWANKGAAHDKGLPL